MKYLLLALGLALPAYAGEPALAQEVSAQWAKYQAALKSNDLHTLTSMARFPIHCNEFKGNIKSAREFGEQYKLLFPEKTKHCFQSSALHAQKSNGRVYYEAWCDVGDYPIRFIFEQVGSTLLLTSIDNVNE